MKTSAVLLTGLAVLSLLLGACGAGFDNPDAKTYATPAQNNDVVVSDISLKYPAVGDAGNGLKLAQLHVVLVNKDPANSQTLSGVSIPNATITPVDTIIKPGATLTSFDGTNLPPQIIGEGTRKNITVTIPEKQLQPGLNIPITFIFQNNDKQTKVLAHASVVNPDLDHSATHQPLGGVDPTKPSKE